MAPLFDASAVSGASGLQTSTLSQSWSQDVAAGFGIIAAICTNGGSATGVPAGTPTASLGGTSLPYLGSVLMNNLAIGGFIAVWAGPGVPSGLGKTATYSITNSGLNFSNAFGSSYTYSGVGSIGSLQTAFGSSGTASVTVPSAVGRLVWGALAQYQAGAYSSFSLANTRQSNGGSPPGYIVGDGAGSASVVVSGNSSAGAFAAAGFELLPAPGLVIPNVKVTQAINRASRY